MKTLQDKIQSLKKEKNALILAHYYVNDEIQEIADYVGDSYYLSQISAQASQKTIVFCGVGFMGESAKILSPDKTVLLPDIAADCPMAHMAELEKIQTLRKQYEELAVVCYINSTAQIKAASDVCVTSANAVKIVRALPQKCIYFIPDGNLGSYVAKQVPEKEFIVHDGFCPVHNDITVEMLEQVKTAHPKAKVMVHPECRPEVVAKADYIGSTTGILKAVKESAHKEFIIGTEMGIFYELLKDNPEKSFYPIGKPVCRGMKLITLEKVASCLEQMAPSVTVDKLLSNEAGRPLAKMLELAK